MIATVEAPRDDLYTTSTLQTDKGDVHRIFKPVIFEGMDLLRYFHEQRMMESSLTEETMREVYDLSEAVSYAEGKVEWETVVNPS